MSKPSTHSSARRTARAGMLSGQAGFTLMEVLVATTLTGVLMAITIGHVLLIRQGYFDDVIRTRINSNLRSAMDIMAMNIRQAGENLQTSFPVVVLADGGTASDTLSLRRNLVQEVLTICANAAAGASTINVSSATLTNPECRASNVASLYTVFRNYRTANSGNVRAFIYNRLTGAGEFVNYTSDGSSGGQYYLTTSSLSAAYPQISSNVYLLEEYKFSRDAAEESLVLTVNGLTAQPQPVAFSITGFDAVLEMEDGANLHSFAFGSSYSWRDISQIQIYLTGQEPRKGGVVSSAIQSGYFPRNVLSY